MAGPEGLDYGAVALVADRLGFDLTPRVIHAIQALESDLLESLSRA